jgi:arylsulfatase A
MNLLTGILLGTVSVCTLCSANAVQDKPNFIIFLTDDQGYNDVGCFGSPNIKTPNLDRMAREGIRFTSAYVGSPVCGPSRSALMTGSYLLLLLHASSGDS